MRKGVVFENEMG